MHAWPPSIPRAETPFKGFETDSERSQSVHPSNIERNQSIRLGRSERSPSVQLGSNRRSPSIQLGGRSERSPSVQLCGSDGSSSARGVSYMEENSSTPLAYEPSELNSGQRTPRPSMNHVVDMQMEQQFARFKSDSVQNWVDHQNTFFSPAQRTTARSDAIKPKPEDASWMLSDNDSTTSGSYRDSVGSILCQASTTNNYTRREGRRDVNMRHILQSRSGSDELGSRGNGSKTDRRSAHRTDEQKRAQISRERRVGDRALKRGTYYG